MRTAAESLRLPRPVSRTHVQPQQQENGYEQTHDDVKESWSKRVGAVQEITNHRRRHKTSKIADRIDESDGGRRRRFAEEGRGHRPEGRKKSVCSRSDRKTCKRKPKM